MVLRSPTTNHRSLSRFGETGHRKPDATMSARTIVDFGAHIHPTDPEAYAFVHRFIEDGDGAAICTDIEPIAARYGEAGIDAAVLSQPLFMGHDDAALTRAANDTLLETIEPYDIFFALAGIPTGAGGSEAAAEFERCLEEGYHGGAVEAGGETRLTDPAFEPVFEVADRTGAPILVHPELMQSLGEAAFDDSLQENAIWGREVAIAANIAAVIHEGVLDRYPDLNLVFHHLGGNIASMAGRIHLRLEKGQWPGLDDVKPFDEFAQQLADRVYLDTSGYYGYVDPLETALERVSASRLLYATDFPYETRDPETFGKIVDAVDDVADAEAANAILGGNALDLLVNVS
jgi:predicted TIM-barrel fold metal-dependent hydrolase